MSLIDRLQFNFSRKLPIFLQTQATECGLICVAMIAAFHDDLDLPQLRRRHRISFKGASFEQLLAIAATLQLAGRAVRTEPEGLRHLQMPCILHWDMGHFVVLANFCGRNAVIHDPALGKRTLSLKEMSEHFTGAAMEFAPTHSFGAPPKKVHSDLNLWKMAGKIKGLNRSLGHLFLIGVGIEILTLLSPLFIQWVTDHALVTGDKELLFTLGIGFGLLFIVRTVLEGIRGWAVVVMSTMFNLQWMSNVFTHLLRLPVLYYEGRHLGDITSRFSVIQTLQNALTVSFVEAIVDGIMVIGTIIMMWIYSPALAGVGMVAAILYVLARLALHRFLRQASYEKIVHEARQQSIFIETIRGIVSLRMANREESRISLWLNHLVRTKNSGLQEQRFQLIFRSLNTLLFGLARIAVVVLGALAVLDAQFSVGMLLAFIAYKDQFSIRASSLIDRLFELKLLELQGMRLADIVLIQPEQEPILRNLPPIALEANLELRMIRFRYGDTEPMVLDGCSLKIESGQFLAITGLAGSGKTSLLKATLGLFPHSMGDIYFGGIAIKKLGLHNYRDLVAAVLQDEILFAGTVAENISFFSQHLDDSLMENCAQLVGLHAEINTLPMRYQTIIGDLGTALSGSQRQRLLLARALYRQPKILILDEACSHLDPESERILLRKLREIGLTVIFISQRIEAIGEADRVMLLKNGKLFDITGAATL